MHATILDVHTERTLSIVQFATAHQDTFQYMSSEKAIKENVIEVREVSDVGSVNSLIVLNRSDFFVFMMDGDILAGAKQNRVVNTSILLAPKSKTIIPVSCVEQGRWRHTSEKFSSAEHAAPAFLRASKARRVTDNLVNHRGHASDQGEVWDGVALFQLATQSDSPTSNLSDSFSRKAGEIDTFIDRFIPHPQANGLAVFTGRDMLSLDIFNRKDVYSEYFPKILRGVALEAFSMKKPDAMPERAELDYRVVEFFDVYEGMEFSHHDGVALGSERRFDSGGLTGCELRYLDHMIHLTALKTGTSPRRAA